MCTVHIVVGTPVRLRLVPEHPRSNFLLFPRLDDLFWCADVSILLHNCSNNSNRCAPGEPHVSPEIAEPLKPLFESPLGHRQPRQLQQRQKTSTTTSMH